MTPAEARKILAQETDSIPMANGYWLGGPLHGQPIDKAQYKPQPKLAYFAEAVGVNRIKIGQSNDPKSRVEALSTGSPVPLRLIKVTSKWREAELHKRFAHLRQSREWFADCAELREFIEREAA